MFQTKVVGKKKTHILRSVTFSRKSCRLWDNVDKIWYSLTGHKWQYYTTHVLWMVDKWGCAHARTHTHSKYAILITFPQQWLRQRSSALRLYVQCLSCVCFFVESVVEFSICGQAMLSAWSSRAVYSYTCHHVCRHVSFFNASWFCFMVFYRCDSVQQILFAF